MIFKSTPFRSSLASLLANSSFSMDELSKLRQRAWKEQGLLIVYPHHSRLTKEEKLVLLDIAERLYGGSET